jgi:hypothetical protein
MEPPHIVSLRRFSQNFSIVCFKALWHTPLISVARLFSVIVHLIQINGGFPSRIIGFQHFQAGWNTLFLP